MKTIIIQSIGTAKPGITKVLSEAFAVNHQLLTQMIYNAPSVFLHKIDDETAQKANALLSELGLDVSEHNADEPLPSPSEKIDIALYIQNPAKIQEIAQQLADFIGINEKEAFGLLIQDPAIVLGGVSRNTAIALESRIDAEVMVSNPREATYTILVKDFTPTFINEFSLLCQNAGHKLTHNRLTGIPHAAAQKLFTKVQDTQKIKLVNEDFIRYKINLNAVDAANQDSVRFLNKQIGMPIELIKRLSNHLPLEIEESIAKCKVAGYLKLTKEAGLDCVAAAVPVEQYLLNIENIAYKKEVEKTLDMFFKKVEINETRWQTPHKLDSVLNRLLSQQLEALGCDVEPVYN